MGWVQNVTQITADEFSEIKAMFDGATTVTDIVFDYTSIPENRVSPVEEAKL